MIKSAEKINGTTPEFQASFQGRLFEHWKQIQQGSRYPSKRDFRPQMFPKYLPQIAIVSVEDQEHFKDRLTGSTVSEVLRLNASQENLAHPSDERISEVVRSMLGQTSAEDSPMYFRGTFEPETHAAIDFSALILPFRQEEARDHADLLLLAFDFGLSRSQGSVS